MISEINYGTFTVYRYWFIRGFTSETLKWFRFGKYGIGLWWQNVAKSNYVSFSVRQRIVGIRLRSWHLKILWPRKPVQCGTPYIVNEPLPIWEKDKNII